MPSVRCHAGSVSVRTLFRIRAGSRIRRAGLELHSAMAACPVHYSLNHAGPMPADAPERRNRGGKLLAGAVCAPAEVLPRALFLCPAAEAGAGRYRCRGRNGWNRTAGERGIHPEAVWRTGPGASASSGLGNGRMAIREAGCLSAGNPGSGSMVLECDLFL